MKLKNQVSSLSLSKKLKKLGVKQESLFVWFENKVYYLEDFAGRGKIADCSAFTVAELGEMLPIRIRKYKGSFYSKSGKRLNGWFFHYGEKEWPDYKYETEANARAKCLIYLKENKLIK